MVPFDYTQIIILALFLGALFAALVFVKRFQPQLREKFAAGHTLHVHDRIALGGQSTAFHVSLKDQDFLVVTSRKSGANICQIAPQDGVKFDE